MSLFAVALVLAACITHAGWNLLSKRVSATPAFFLLATWPWSCWQPRVRRHGGRCVAGHVGAGVGVLLAAGVFEALYFVCLAGAYRHGNVSVVYPIARALPIFVVLAGDATLGRFPSTIAVVGLGLVAAGCFLLPCGG